MTPSGPERYISIRLNVSAHHPALLEGLESWLKLGLISDLEVGNLAQRYLSCLLPVPELIAAVAASPSPANLTPPLHDHPTEPSSAVVSPPHDRPVHPSDGWVSQFLQSLMNEVSVVWLLFLGVFLVVVSSAVLAASQWRNFSAVGQYGVLLTYTLAFVGASLWTGTRSQLHLTSRMLQVASLLIIPVNFWVMDSFRLLQTPLGIGFAAIAALILSGATVWLLPRPQTAPTVLAAILGLSWLHWGWGWPGLALGATYVGCISTAFVSFFQSQRRLAIAQRSPQDTAIIPSLWWNRISLGDVALPYAVLLLLFRAWIIAAVPLAQLGLAFGICGWLLCWLSRDLPQQSPSALRLWGWVGTGLLGCGWLASVWTEPPWQALIVSGLGVGLLGDRLKRRRQSLDLVGTVGLGLVAAVLFVRLIPAELRAEMVNRCIDWTGAEGMPLALAGVVFYPYLWGVLGLSARLRRWQTPDLMQTAHGLSWILGAGLVGLSFPNSIWRSLTLGLSFATLCVVLRQKRVVGETLVYITHLVGLAALGSTIGSLWPNLSLERWSFVCLGAMVAEWATLTRLNPKPLWQRSTWHIGLGLAALGYLLGLFHWLDNPDAWNLAVLLIPTGLSALAFWPPFRWTQLAVGLSMASVIVDQLLTFSAPTPRLVGLGVGTALMVLNTLRWPTVSAAGLSVGFGLAFSYAATWEVWHDTIFPVWFNLSVIPLWILFGLRHLLSRREAKLNHSYTVALDGWAIALMVLMLGVASLNTVLSPWVFLDISSLWRWPNPHHWSYGIASLLTVGALGYRYWQRPAQGWLVGLAGAIQMTLLFNATYFHQSLRFMSIATLGFGLVSLGLSQYWGRRTEPPFPWSTQVIPLGYVALGWLFSQVEWRASTGFFTLAAAGLAIIIGRRHPAWIPLTLSGLMGLSFGAYELLFYQLLQASGGQPGDAFLLFAALATAITLLERGLDRWARFLLNLDSPQLLKIFAHIHWGIGSFWLAVALGQPMSRTAEDLWGLNLAILGGYALFQGRSPAPFGWGWVYLGLAELIAALGNWLYLQIPASQLLPWAAAIASGVALALHSLPWQRWGWSPVPFGHMALVLPGFVGLLSATRINTASLLLTSAFYGWMALVRQTPRLSYLGLLPANWAALRILDDLQLSSRVWAVSLMGLSLLFIAQIDPDLRSPSRRDLRHLLRCFAVGLVSVTILYESDAYFGSGLLAIGLSLGLILLGLRLQVRAFLYVGTLTFIAKILRIIWLFIAQESLVLWALGIGLGLVLIWIAATFEARRVQVTTLLQYWVTTLESWQ
ncbi:MAG: hypothetical protein WCD18_00550 [Thermosynechococcaceae cyanobacterium]